MAVVVSHDPFSIGFMQRKRIVDAMRNFRGCYDSPCLDLDPASQILSNDVAVKIKQSFKSNIRLRGLIISSDDIHCELYRY
ncbi:hypothetical protein SAMN05720354_12941 [Nitrosospira sp. Nsp1]|nr:hypothetical protein SAMN05720354_12941 [Nitrosospira sp. Nsp1]